MEESQELVICPMCDGKGCEHCDCGMVTEEEYEKLYCEKYDI